MSELEELVLADVRRINVKPGDVIVVQLDELPISADGFLEPLDAIEKFMHDVFPANRTVIIDSKTKLEVRSAEPDWDLIATKVVERMVRYAACA